jgi:hypothetical protein
MNALDVVNKILAKDKAKKLKSAAKKKRSKKASRRFTSTFTVTVELEISDRLIKEALSPDWQESFYEFANAQAVADHIAYNIARGNSLKSLDGFAHLEDADVVVHEEEWTED